MKHKKIILTVIFLFLIITLLSLIFYFYSKEKTNSPSAIAVRTNEAIEDFTGQKTPKSVAGILSKLSKSNLSEQDRYAELLKIRDYLSFVYTNTLSPEVREFIQKDLNDYAKNNLPASYNPSDFIIVCSDPKCGEPLDSEMESLINEVSALKMPEINKDTINYNLKLSAGLSTDYLEEKQSGFNLVIRQLNDLGTYEASLAANKLKSYFEKKYNSKL